MISLEKYKELVKRETQDLTDKEIEELYNAQCALVEIIFDEWLKDKHIKTTLQ